LLDVSVTDARGMTVHKTVRLDPSAVKLTFGTQPARLRLSAGGVVRRAPFSRRFIVGGHLVVSAPEVQRRQGVTYRFRRWSDGGDRSHDLVAPRQPTTLTAAYRPVKAQVRVRTSPEGLEVEVGGERTPGFRADLKVGSTVELAAPARQTVDGVTYVFVKWSDGGARVHRVTVGAERVSVRAVYRRT
jgi:hypothetical protein